MLGLLTASPDLQGLPPLASGHHVGLCFSTPLVLAFAPCQSALSGRWQLPCDDEPRNPGRPGATARFLSTLDVSKDILTGRGHLNFPAERGCQHSQQGTSRGAAGPCEGEDGIIMAGNGKSGFLFTLGQR
ncbi:hypothetical protein GHT09_019670 [Marmota monax]|uniref:Uncharacterized protein n=1 Tax=Marmota monax TaxID=9995 RepID=A0A834PPC4_MARMO|nr:hypothetical protein GHT09_019670 [Marmota monax]